MVDKEVFFVVGSIHIIKFNEEQYDRMFFFQDAKKFKEKLSNFAAFNKVIKSKDILGSQNKFKN